MTERFAGPNGDIPCPDPVDIPPPLGRELPLRIVVLAAGAITPLGNSAEATWENYKAGKSGIVEKRYPPFTEPTFKEGVEIAPQIRAVTAGTIKGFDKMELLVKTGVLPFKEVKNRIDPYVAYALAAVFEALGKVRTADGTPLLIPRLNPDGSPNKERKWVINSELAHPLHSMVTVGTGFGGGDVSAEVYQLLLSGNIPGDHMMRSLADRASSTITQAFDIRGGGEANTAACASSGKAFENLIYRILTGRLEWGVTVGTEGILEKPIATAMFDSMGALDIGRDPLTVSRSLHKTRRGFTIAEGAVAFVIASPDWAKRHGIPILYEVIGMGSTSGAGDNVAPNRVAQEQAMRFALRQAALTEPKLLSNIGKWLVSGHFTGTDLGEPSEMLATQNVLELVKKLTSIYGSKRLAGHLLGAAGNLSLLVAGETVREGIKPGMVFDGEVMDEAFGWDIPLETTPDPDLQFGLVNQFGFGDANNTLVIKKAT